MAHSRSPKRYARFPLIEKAVRGLRQDECCLTTYLAAGDENAFEAVANEVILRVGGLVRAGQVSAISLVALPLPAFNSEPDRFQVSTNFQSQVKRELKAHFAHFIARAVTVPQWENSGTGFKWEGRLVVLGIEFDEGSDRTRLAKREPMSQQSLNGVTPKRIEAPDFVAFDAFVKEFLNAQRIITNAAKKPFSKHEGKRALQMRLQISDGLNQFASLVPLKKVIFGNGLGQECIRRALVGLDADIKHAKKLRGPDQLQIQHEWWRYRSARKSSRLQPLLVVN